MTDNRGGDMRDSEGNPPSSFERQLGDVVGTVRMAVAAIDTLRETVERLAERAAFRADLETLSSNYHRQIEGLKTELDRQRTAFTATQRLVWMAMGAVTVITVALNFLRPIIFSGN